MFKVTTTLRFTSEEFRIIQEVLARLDPFLYGDEFHINKLGNLVQVISRKEHRCWHFNSKGNCEQVLQFGYRARF